MIALCMSLILMFVMSWMQRREDSLLAAIDEYCMENLLHKVSVSATSEVNQSMVELALALREAAEQWKGMQAMSNQEHNRDGQVRVDPAPVPIAATGKTAR